MMESNEELLTRLRLNRATAGYTNWFEDSTRFALWSLRLDKYRGPLMRLSRDVLLQLCLRMPLAMKDRTDLHAWLIQQPGGAAYSLGNVVSFARRFQTAFDDALKVYSERQERRFADQSAAMLRWRVKCAIDDMRAGGFQCSLFTSYEPEQIQGVCERLVLDTSPTAIEAARAWLIAKAGGRVEGRSFAMLCRAFRVQFAVNAQRENESVSRPDSPAAGTFPPSEPPVPTENPAPDTRRLPD